MPGGGVRTTLEIGHERRDISPAPFAAKRNHAFVVRALIANSEEGKHGGMDREPSVMRWTRNEIEREMMPPFVVRDCAHGDRRDP